MESNNKNNSIRFTVTAHELAILERAVKDLKSKYEGAYVSEVLENDKGHFKDGFRVYVLVNLEGVTCNA